MSRNISFTIEDLAAQLNTGVSTVKVWYKRYKDSFPLNTKNQEGMYLAESLKLFKIIAQCSAAGMDISSIKEILDIKTNNSPNNEEQSPTIPDSADLNSLSDSSLHTEKTTRLDKILMGILNQQEKIAIAQERRADAEERKASALESQAEAEFLKATIFQEMLSTIKESSIQSTVNSMMARIKNIPNPAISESQILSPEPDLPDDFDDLPELTESIYTEQSFDDTEIKTEAQHEEEKQKIDHQQESEPQLEIDIDDLSLLLDEDPTSMDEDIDNLSLLIDMGEPPVTEDIDNLALLIDAKETQVAEDIDDLALLIDDKETQIAEDIDDLSLLINEARTQTPEDIPGDIDDLSKLIDIKEAPPKEQIQAKKPAAGDYKSQILTRIIIMKGKEKLSVEETTKRFNNEGLKTLSGKGQWDTKTIAGIYKYIDSVQNKGK